MARANLNIKQEISDAFSAALESKSVRFIKICIQDEDMVLDEVVDKQGTLPEDFDTLLRNSLCETQAHLVLFNLGNSAEWSLIAWVPDGCRVRDKMLYSSSREDLKRHLGFGHFKSEYGANELVDITWAQYLESQRTDLDTTVMTEAEKLLLEEKVKSIYMLTL
jgi:twinfilin